MSFGTPNVTARTVTARAVFKLTAKSGSGFKDYSLYGDLELNGTDYWNPFSALYTCYAQTITLADQTITLSYPDSGTGPSFNARAYVEMRTSTLAFSLPAMTINKTESAPNIAASAVTYTISYNSNGGSVSPSSQVYTVGGTSLTTPTPTRSGYEFTGWYSAASGGSYIVGSGSSYAPSSSTTLYAQWLQSFTVSFNYGIGSGSISSRSGSSITLPSATPPTNYSFSGWYTASSGGSLAGSANSSYTPTASITLYARYLLTTVTPEFTDQTLSSTAFLNMPYETTAVNDKTIFATNTKTYAIIAPSPVVSGYTNGLPPGMTISTVTGTGTISGSPTKLGNYAFRVEATSTTDTKVNSSNILISVYPPIKRALDSSSMTQVVTMKRFIGIGQTTTNAQNQTISADANGFVDVSRIKKYNSVTNQWEDVSNI